jgi:hypothetical protein
MERFKLVSVNEKRNAARLFPRLLPAGPAPAGSGGERHGRVGRRSSVAAVLETVAIYAYLGAGAAAVVLTVAAILVHALR